MIRNCHVHLNLALGLQEQPDAVGNPWRLVLQQPDQSEHPLPPGTHITQVYDDAGGELLILGEPGSGKTTLLLELTRDLLDRAQKDDSYPMPVVFNLSSWAVKRQPLIGWMVEELKTKYQVPHELGRSWAGADQILPLLDGLDEVAKEYRAACVDAINGYRHEHMVPIVVCSRSTEYFSQKKRVLLRSAVTLQPLTEQQVDDYLSSVGGQMAAVRVALREDAELQELATTPLMLSVLTLAYQGKSVEDILATSSSEAQRRVFEAYVKRMLERRSREPSYTPEQTIHWLAWLAHQMAQHNQTEFYIEQMQPDLLSTDRSSQAYEKFANRFPGILIGALVGLVVNGLLHASFDIVSPIRYILIGGLIGSLFIRKRPEESPTQKNGLQRKKWYQRISSTSIDNGLFIGLASALILGLRDRQLYGLTDWLLDGLSYGLIFGISSIILSVIFEERNIANTQIEIDTKSWRRLWHILFKDGHVKNGLLVGLIVGLSYALSVGLSVGLGGCMKYL